MAGMSGRHDKAPELTADTFCRGQLKVSQYRDGYRFSVDAVLLADFAGQAPGTNVVEFGTGCGIVSLLMACRNPQQRFHAVEIQSELADLAATNVRANRLSRRITVMNRDLRTMSSADFSDPVDVLVANPPFHPLGTGRINPDSQKAVARHELAATLNDVILAARRTLPLSGRLVMIYPAERAVDLSTEMRLAGIEPKRQRFVQSYENEPAALVLVQGVRGAGTGLITEAPLVVYREDGVYTGPVEKILAG
jgi:tRNA1Val (adenine37-N6)-methyltransferase